MSDSSCWIARLRRSPLLYGVLLKDNRFRGAFQQARCCLGRRASVQYELQDRLDVRIQNAANRRLKRRLLQGSGGRSDCALVGSLSRITGRWSVVHRPQVGFTDSARAHQRDRWKLSLPVRAREPLPNELHFSRIESASRERCGAVSAH
jgi:hypothetical protein